MKNKIVLLILVISCITRSADGPQVFEQADAVAAPMQVERIVNLPKIIEAAKQGENFKFEIKSKIISAIAFKMGFKETMVVRSKLFSKIDALFGDKDDQGSVSEADLCAILGQIKDELGLQLNILTSDVAPIVPDVDLEVAAALDAIVNQISNPVTPVVISDADEPEKSCVICYDQLDNGEEIRRGICDAPRHRHVFHKECIDKWLANMNNEDLCPKCKQLFFKRPMLYAIGRKVLKSGKSFAEGGAIGCAIYGLWRAGIKFPDLALASIFASTAVILNSELSPLNLINPPVTEQRELVNKIIGSTAASCFMLGALSFIVSGARSIEDVDTRLAANALALGMGAVNFVILNNKLLHSTRSVVNGDFSPGYKLSLGGLGLCGFLVTGGLAGLSLAGASANLILIK